MFVLFTIYLQFCGMVTYRVFSRSLHWTIVIGCIVLWVVFRTGRKHVIFFRDKLNGMTWFESAFFQALEALNSARVWTPQLIATYLTFFESTPCQGSTLTTYSFLLAQSATLYNEQQFLEKKRAHDAENSVKINAPVFQNNNDECANFRNASTHNQSQGA